MAMLSRAQWNCVTRSSFSDLRGRKEKKKEIKREKAMENKEIERGRAREERGEEAEGKKWRKAAKVR